MTWALGGLHVHRLAPALRRAAPRIAAAALLLNSPAAVLAQTASPPVSRLEEYVVEVFTVDDGLPSNVVREVEQTPDGYLWLGTANGLVRFDGVTFTTFNRRNMPALTGTWIEELCVANDGSLWIAPRDGGLIRHGDGYTTSYGTDQGLPASPVAALSKGSGPTLWIGTLDGGLFRFDGERFAAVPMPGLRAPRRVVSIHEDERGALWLASPDDGVYRFDQGRWDLFGRSESFAGRRIRGVGTDASGTLWAGGDGRVFCYNPGEFRELDLAPLDWGSGRSRFSIIEDRTGQLWLGGAEGIVRGRPGAFEIVDEANGLPDLRVRDILEDREGSVWVATYSGLGRLKKGRFSSYNTSTADDRFGQTLLQTRDGTVWAGGRGLWRLGITNFEPIVLDPDIRDRIVYSLAEDADGYLWVATTNGLVRTDGVRTRLYTTDDGLPDNDVRLVYADARGDVWVGSLRSGLSRWNGTRFEPIDGLEERHISEVHRDRPGRLWMAFVKAGLARWDGERLLPFATSSGSSSPRVYDFHEAADGTLWMVTGGSGLWRFREESLTTYTTVDGLFTDSALAIVEDDAGTLWMSSDDGVFSVRKLDLDAFDAGRIASIPCSRYTRSHGLPRIEADSHGFPSAIKTADGRLWFSMNAGFVAVADPDAATSSLPPPVHIEGLTAGGELAVSNDRMPSRPSDLYSLEHVVLPLGARDVEIAYTATSLRSPGLVRFRHQLVGHDDGWIDARDRRFVRYASLAPGQYEFRVSARNDQGEWNEDGARITFVVPARYYEALWFRALVALALVASAYGAYHNRTRSLQRRATELQRLVEQRDESLAERDRSQASLEAALQEVGALQKRLEQENLYLREEITATHGFAEIVGESGAIRRALGRVEQVAKTDSTVLILGETGTGKELVARAVHDRSGRRERPLVKINCAALPETLIESELFGHEKGAFTGADARRPGRFELADGGTLLLDEIGDLSAGLQTKLLRVLQEGEFERVGGTQTLRVDVRIITATNRDLPRAIAEGRFRSDLFYRLNVFPIELPPLRQRREDIPLLVWYFAERMAKNAGKHFEAIPAPLMDGLVAYDWPGNVRELHNVVERAVVVSPGPVLLVDEVLATGAAGVVPPKEAASNSSETGPASDTLKDAERRHILGVLNRCGWKVRGPGGAAEALGLKESTLRTQMKRLGIRRPPDPGPGSGRTVSSSRRS